MNTYLPLLPWTSSATEVVVEALGAVVTGLAGSEATASGTDTTIELVAAIGEAKW